TNIIKENIFDYSKAKNILSEASVNALYKLIKAQIFDLENNLLDFITFPIEKKITIEHLLSESKKKQFKKYGTKFDDIINILRYGHPLYSQKT
nr:hypothetical protein [Treponema sp.]